MKSLPQIAWLNSRKRIALSIVALVVLAAVIAFFHPALQTRVLRDQVGARLDAFEVERVHVLPWSLTVDAMTLSHEGLHIGLDSAEIGFSPWKMLFDVVQINRLAVAGLNIDLRQVPPSTEQPQPFPGLFKLLDHGFGIRLVDADVFGRVFIDEDLSSEFRLNGGELEPDNEGQIDIEASLTQASDGTRVGVSGTVTVAQGSPGEFSRLVSDLKITAASPSLARDETLRVNVVAEPTTEEITDEDDGEVVGKVITGDRFRLIAAQTDGGNDFLRLSATGEHQPGEQRVIGNYELIFDDGLLSHYAPQAVMPKFAENASGPFELDLRAASANLGFNGVMQIKELERVLGANSALPEQLQLMTQFSVTHGAGKLELHGLEARLEHDDNIRLVTLALTEAMTVPLDSPASLLEEQRKIAALTFESIPLVWINGLLPEQAIRDGSLNGQFDIAVNSGALELVPVADLGVEAASFDEKFKVPDLLKIRMTPSVVYRTESLQLELGQFVVQLGEQVLASLDADALVGLVGEGSAASDLRLAAEVDLSGVAELPILSEHLAGYEIPAGLNAKIDFTANLNSNRVRVKQLAASVRQNDAPPLLTASTLQAFAVALAGETPEFRNPEGELALTTINDIDLKWIDPLVEQATLSGVLEAGTFALSTGANGLLSLRTREPLVLRKLSARTPSERYVDDLTLRLRPEIDYTPSKLEVRYADLDASIGGRNLLLADGALTVPLDVDESPPRVDADGRFQLNIGQLHKIPLLADKLGRLPAKRNWRLEADYGLSGSAERIDVNRLRAGITIDGQKRVRFENDTALTVRPQVGDDEDLAQHLTGALSADIDNLSSSLLADIVPLGNVTFDSLVAKVTLRSDGRVLTADGSEALSLKGVRVGSAEARILDAFSVHVAGGLQAVGQTVDAELDNIGVVFDSHKEQPALAGSMSFTLEPPHTVPLRRMEAKLSGMLPPLLSQPVLMPGHSLRQGEFRLDATVREDGAIKSLAVLDGLEASKPLAISSIRAEASGVMAADGRGFNFEMPIVGSGRTGDTDGLMVANYDPSGSDKALLKLDFSSKRFLLNDVLAALKSISAAKPKESKQSKKKKTDEAVKPIAEAAPQNLTPDKKAFWNVLPYDTRVNYRIDDLYYTDYVIFNDVAGELGLNSNRLTLASLAARFHDSPMRFDGALDFVDESAKPYQLQFDGTVSDFDLNQFFTELVPGSKPRAEGLFGIAINGYGSSPNMGQFRNELLFDMKLNSREGLFRPLPPDSTLMAGASDVLGFVGEGLSYMPTGGFGAGAVSRLVNYISVIDYDRIDIHVVRDETRDIEIRQFLVQSPTISLTAEGGIDYAYGKDILDSPLVLDARLNMSGKGAAILYSMDLLEDEKDKFGYYKGPAFRIRGTPAAAESNFAEIVTTAADGTVKGGITRPISGLIGNIKHRWFGDEPLPYRDSAEDAAIEPSAESADQETPQSTAAPQAE